MPMALVFRKITKKDVYQFEKWGKHSDPRFFQYNFPYNDPGEFEAWYHAKQKWVTRKVFGLFLEEYPLAFVTLKHIKWFRKTAELGIAVDPNYLSEGFGTELLKRFLNHVFSTYPFESMTLRVAHFNHRAQKSYEKVGFEVVERRLEPFEEQGFKDLVLAQYPEQFDTIDGTLYTTFYVMRISKERFYALHDNL